MRRFPIALIIVGVLTVSAVIAVLTWADWAAPAVLALGILGLAVFILRRYFHIPHGQPATAWRIEIVALPLVLALHVQNTLITVGGVALLAFWSLLRRRPSGAKLFRGKAWIVALALTVGAFSVILRERDSYETFIALGTALVIFRTASTTTARQASTSLIDGLYLFVIANVVGYYVLGLTSPAAADRLQGLEAASGGLRVFFPFTTSLNLAPAMAACALAASVVLVERGWKLLYRVAGVACAIVILAASNARLALAAAALVTVLLTFAPRLGRYVAPILAVASLPIAFLFAPLSVWLASVAPFALSSIPGVDRGSGARDLLTLNSRNVIWDGSIQFWTHFVPPTEILFGYGPLGQFTSGASGSYAFVFQGGLAQAATASTHNSVLQQMYDGGLVGLALLLVGIVGGLIAAVRFTSRSAPWAAGTVGAMSLIVISGATEVSFAPGYQQETFWVLFALCIFTLLGQRDHAALGTLAETEGATAPVRLDQGVKARLR